MDTDYEIFKKKIFKVLGDQELGLTWTQIRRRLRLKQKVPYNGWVKQLEKDIKMRRIKNSNGTVWTLGSRR